MRKMLQSLAILTILFVLTNVALGQIFVSPGENTLYQALQDSYDGDVFQLVAGGEYIESNYTEIATIIDKNITIEVEGDANEKAIIKLPVEREEDDETLSFFYLGNNSSLTLKGIEFDGSYDGERSVNYIATFDMGETPTETNINKIHIENCYIHDLLDYVVSAGNSDMKYYVIVDSTSIDNCIIENTGAAIYYKYCGTNYISLTNSTIFNNWGYGFRVSGPVESGFTDNTPTVVIDHTTWFKIGQGESLSDRRETIQGEKGPLNNPWTVTNSIFVNQLNKDRTFINIKDTPGDAGATISGICFWDIGNVNFREHSVADTLRMYPDFADTSNGDFTLPWKSPTFTMGTDGGPIGDPRWTDNSVAIDNNEKIAEEFQLEQNYPNPFNPTTMIAFQLAKSANTTLTVYDVLGHEIDVMVNETLSAGIHRFNFDATALHSGVYFYRLTSGNMSLTRKMMLIK